MTTLNVEVSLTTNPVGFITRCKTGMGATAKLDKFCLGFQTRETVACSADFPKDKIGLSA